MIALRCSPVEGHGFAELPLVDVAVEDVVADVGGSSFHTLDEYFSFCHIKVVVEELTRVFGLPKKIFGNVAPELCPTQTKRIKRGRQEIIKMFLNSSCKMLISDTFVKSYRDNTTLFIIN